MKLDKKTQARIAEAVDKLRKAEEERYQFVEKFNEALEKAWHDLVEPANGKHQEALQEAKELADEIASDIQASYDDKSERWQESDRGSAVQSMADDWSGLDLEQDPLEEPDNVELPNYQHSYEMEQAPTEPSL